ncbi:Uncharacterized phage-encoded protein [Anaerobiospirillum thomasii]|uniref:BRO-N domain-containing protein n=1 Tax=Anaerobiospirillum thomasii TaxID=179995 RepID=UPI000D9208A2|nr:BRO family protein [Anaerobiospirillum thomasii]SPT71539.1 Uncharacterized phage-encoded protein [Anaerobiospirillum thomasii]
MSNVSIFNFNANKVRTAIINNQVWFCKKDVLTALNISYKSDINKSLDPNGVVNNSLVTSTRGVQTLAFVNEPNLYRIIFKSRKAEARAFQDWVFNEVLPQIRKTGQYAVPKIDKSLSYVKKLDVIKQSLPSEIGATLDEIIDKAKKQGFMIASNPNCKNATRLDMNVNAEERLFDMFNKLNLSVEAKAELKRTLEEIRDNEASRVRANALEELKPIKKFIDTVGMYQDELRDFTAKSLRQSDCPPIMPFICASLPQLRHKLG